MSTKLALAVSVVVWIVAAGLNADDTLLEQFYGSGVHAYNQGDYLGAYESLSSAIKGGTNDPRAYYFRGLAYLKLGRDPEAKADFQAGAELEVGDSSDVYPVNRSLERVQGRSRQILEQYRTIVHAAAVQHKEAERQARYEERAAAEQEVLRRVPTTELPSNMTGQPIAHPENDGVEPAKSNNSLDKTAPESDKNPFEAEPIKPAKKSTPANSDNPFGESEPTPPKTSTSTPAANDDPFGTPQPTTPPSQKPMNGTTPPQAERSDNREHSESVQPTPGGLGSLMRAVVKGSQGDQMSSSLPAGSPSPPLQNILRGMFNQGPAAPVGTNSNDASPPPVHNNSNGGGVPPAADAPVQPGTAPATPMPGNEQPAVQPSPPAGTPQPNNPAQPPKDSDNPFN
jgi:hypothetical protein